MNDTEMRVLASEVSEIKKTLNEIRSCLLGTVNGGVGLLASHNRVEEEVNKCKTRVRAIEFSVSELKMDKVRVVAWVAGAGAVGGFIVGGILWLAEKLKII